MKQIPKKNYIILLLVIIVTIALTYYFYLWYSAYNKSKLETSILENYIQVIQYNELNNYIFENEKVYIYASVKNDKEINIFEKNFKNALTKEKLKSKVLYLNLTEQLKSKDKLDYNLNENNLPCILVFDNAKLEDIYSIKENNYNVDKVIAYLISKGAKDIW